MNDPDSAAASLRTCVGFERRHPHGLPRRRPFPLRPPRPAAPSSSPSSPPTWSSRSSPRATAPCTTSPTRGTASTSSSFSRASSSCSPSCAEYVRVLKQGQAAAWAHRVASELQEEDQGVGEWGQAGSHNHRCSNFALTYDSPNRFLCKWCNDAWQFALGQKSANELSML